VRRRVAALVAAAGVAVVLAACGSKDNGGVIQGPTGTTVPAATSTTGGSGTPGY
jgi:hypothetical protein